MHSVFHILSSVSVSVLSFNSTFLLLFVELCMKQNGNMTLFFRLLLPTVEKGFLLLARVEDAAFHQPPCLVIFGYTRVFD